MGIVLCGSKDTSNFLNDQMGESEYRNVTTFHNLEKVNLDFFRSIERIQVEDK
jgi:hypothetical protein